MRVNRWELNRGYRGKSSGRNDLRLIECVLRVFGNRGRRSDPESSILTIFARPHDFSKLPKTHARKGPRFQWLSELLRVPRQRAARLASVHRVFLPSFFQWNAARDHSSGGPRWIRFRRNSRDVDKRWNRYNRAALCRAKETESSVQLILGHHTSMIRVWFRGVWAGSGGKLES